MAYLGSYSSSGGAGLAVADVDPTTGTLTIGKAVPNVSDASWLASHGRFLYATNEEDPVGSVTALDPTNL
ncbi:MAG TPA: beta-propeller fold lactonase family protein, partial [Pseudonocardiaceae bacterium]